MSSQKTVILAIIAATVFLLGTFQYASVLAQQAAGDSVTIVPNASTITPGTKAFSPNPINVKVGDTVTWTNKDTVEHTVTSGTGASDTNKGKEFDSGLAGPTALTATGKTFSHKFAAAGTFPYFCQLHPAMMGKVIVA
ncbi:cupredoxin domain-containing protein [Nitrososphaera sp. AFS]|uniref:cupredoxin domain-containing protein n=1 Tax=Nitrososphaera sp. AFS TaxID=2301191 RepID=UPI0013922272|nr:plastocyanin/azurin family copper-binding protein [Nitrososphaera sp. AFS]